MELLLKLDVVAQDLSVFREAAGAHAFVVQAAQHQGKQCLGHSRGSGLGVPGNGGDIAQLSVDRQGHTQRGQHLGELALIELEDSIGHPAAAVGVVDHLFGNKPIGCCLKVFNGINAIQPASQILPIPWVAHLVSLFLVWRLRQLNVNGLPLKYGCSTASSLV